MTDQFSKWCESVKDCGHTVQPDSATARQRKLGWDAAMGVKQVWIEYPKNKPQEGEMLNVVAVMNDKTSCVQYAKFYHTPDAEGEWELFDPEGVVMVTHFCVIPKLPGIHHVDNTSEH